MFKKTMLLAISAVAALAFAVPSIATANWTDNTEEVKSNANVSFAGSASFHGQLGGVSCTQATATATLTGSSNTGTVNSFTADNPQGCSTSGGLAFCTLTKVETTETPWAAHTNGTDITITGVKLHNYFSGGFCPVSKITLTGSVTTTVDDPHAGTTGTLEGTLSAGGLGNVQVTGTQTITPSGTYGIT